MMAFDGQLCMYLLKFHGIDRITHKVIFILCNRDKLSRIAYTLLPTSCQNPRQESLIKISPTGEIHTFSSSGVTNAQVTAHEDFGFNQTAVIQVEV